MDPLAPFSTGAGTGRHPVSRPYGGNTERKTDRMRTDTDTAADYCQRIGQEMAALDTVLRDDASPDTFATLELDPFGPAGDADPADIVGVWMNETALEIVTYRATDDSGRTITNVLRTCGGPRCDIRRESDDGAVVMVTTYMGGEDHTLRLELPSLADYLDQLADY